MKVMIRRSCLGLITMVSKSFAGFADANLTGRTSIASRGVAHDLLDGSFTVIVQAHWSRQVSEVHVHFRIALVRKPVSETDFRIAKVKAICVAMNSIKAYAFCIAIEGTKTSGASELSVAAAVSRLRRLRPFGVSTEHVAAEIMARKMSHPMRLQSK